MASELTRTRFERFSPVFEVRDLRRALAHYRALGFATNAYRGGDEYGFAERDGAELHLAAVGEHSHDGGEHPHSHETSPSQAYLYVEDADALYEEWARPGLGGLTRRVGNTAYKLREGSHLDPDGNLVRFGSPMPSPSVGGLQSHLESHYGTEVTALDDLDVGVWRVRRTDGRDWVVRRFPERRPAEVVMAEAEILRYLEERDFPAERCATAAPVSVLHGRSLLVTEWAEPVPRASRRDALRDAGGLARLGDLLGLLHTLPPLSGPLARPGGAWHHLADGGPADELAAASQMLEDAQGIVSEEEVRAYRALRDEVGLLDDCASLPEAFTHPDFVLANVVATPGGMVIVDWAGAGRGPRLWSLAFLLYAEGCKDLRRVDRVLAGYRRHVALEGEELSRLGAVMRARPLVLSAWAVCTGRTSPSEAMAALAGTKALTEAIRHRAQEVLAA
jgi:Ser/Thr protein kinase RdoA (MazF antagonist)